MTDSAVTILFVMLDLLASVHAPREIVHDNLCDLAEVAIAIDEQDHAPEWYLTIAFSESKFNFRNPDRVITPRPCKGEQCNTTACGIYQQLPAHAAGPPVTCEELRNPWIATSYMSAKFDVFLDRWGPLEDSVCHYCGWSCEPVPKGEDPPAHGDCYSYGVRTNRQVERMRERLDQAQRTPQSRIDNWSMNIPAMCQRQWLRSQREWSMFRSLRSLMGWS